MKLPRIISKPKTSADLQTDVAAVDAELRDAEARGEQLQQALDDAILAGEASDAAEQAIEQHAAAVYRLQGRRTALLRAVDIARDRERGEQLKAAVARAERLAAEHNAAAGKYDTHAAAVAAAARALADKVDELRAAVADVRAFGAEPQLYNLADHVADKLHLPASEWGAPAHFGSERISFALMAAPHAG